jgi:hypothetical protein
VSLLMPHLEPMVVATMREGAEHLGPEHAELAARVRAAAAQEAGHHRQHRAWNQVLGARYGLRHIERWMASTTRVLSRRSLRFRLSFTAGFETIAFATARWVDRRAVVHFQGVSSPAAVLFLWHLAEEVEHRDIAEELHSAVGGAASRRRHAVGMAAALLVLGWFAVLGAARMLAVDRRLLHPVAVARLAWWGVSFAFEALPMAAAMCAGNHGGAAFQDPPWLRAWLDGTDPSAGTIPAFATSLAPPFGVDATGAVDQRSSAVGPAVGAAVGPAVDATVAAAAARPATTVKTATGRIDHRS